MSLAHLGLAVFVMGAVAETFFSAEVVRFASPGDRIEIVGQTLTFEGVTARSGPNYEAEVGTFTLPSGELLERSEEHTSELQSLMRISYAVFCLKKKNKKHSKPTNTTEQ